MLLPSGSSVRSYPLSPPNPPFPLGEARFDNDPFHDSLTFPLLRFVRHRKPKRTASSRRFAYHLSLIGFPLALSSLELHLVSLFDAFRPAFLPAYRSVNVVLRLRWADFS